jgi:predicted neutral ceramidase superfamily lipid hydrolase
MTGQEKADLLIQVTALREGTTRTALVVFD